ncbi:hypothetical protein CWATWH0003_0987 [Crocosphaera watsonii WH 0003]|uniref:Uncharacterized protein n=2 Tax=Crocosphaera watsonii TaxID=263511 RepID=G5J0F1_CROWT|nr:hypothetical protein CWATWH0003_0987 [Crocosphaera watsonii WH 0003]CCQ54507.1 hypothetical protein CWATWH0005_1466 [Crocosphaera watsonii WH 0005]
MWTVEGHVWSLGREWGTGRRGDGEMGRLGAVYNWLWKRTKS